MSGLCLFIGALAGTHGLRVIAMTDETVVSIFAQARRGLVLASSSFEETADFEFARRGLEVLPEDAVAHRRKRRPRDLVVRMYSR